MAEAKLAAEITITGPIILGRICMNINRALLNPNALPASTNSFSRTLSICPLTTLATSTHIVSPTAIKTCQKPLPKAKLIAITNNNVGIDQTTFINQIIKSSIQPLKKPARDPRKIPISSEIETEINPTDKLTRAPIIN